jgi:hypothetical protein
MYESKGTGGGRAVLGATARLVDPDGDLSAGVAASTA